MWVVIADNGWGDKWVYGLFPTEGDAMEFAERRQAEEKIPEIEYYPAKCISKFAIEPALTTENKP